MGYHASYHIPGSSQNPGLLSGLIATHNHRTFDNLAT